MHSVHGTHFFQAKKPSREMLYNSCGRTLLDTTPRVLSVGCATICVCLNMPLGHSRARVRSKPATGLQPEPPRARPLRPRAREGRSTHKDEREALLCDGHAFRNRSAVQPRLHPPLSPRRPGPAAGSRGARVVGTRAGGAGAAGRRGGRARAPHSRAAVAAAGAAATRAAPAATPRRRPRPCASRRPAGRAAGGGWPFEEGEQRGKRGNKESCPPFRPPLVPPHPSPPHGVARATSGHGRHWEGARAAGGVRRRRVRHPPTQRAAPRHRPAPPPRARGTSLEGVKVDGRDVSRVCNEVARRRVRLVFVPLGSALRHGHAQPLGQGAQTAIWLTMHCARSCRALSCCFVSPASGASTSRRTDSRWSSLTGSSCLARASSAGVRGPR